MELNQIPALFDGNDDDRRKIAEYCIQDTILVNQLMIDRKCLDVMIH